ncbi:EXLDI protein [Nocardia sp. NPDC055029]
MTTETHTEAPAIVDTVKPTADGFGPIVVKVGPGGGRTQRFTGRKVGESRQVTRKAVEVVRVYLTHKGNYVVQKQIAEWSEFSLPENWTRDWKNWRAMVGIGEQDWGDFTVEVADSLEALRDQVPPKVYLTIVDRVSHPLIQDLDI